jgi:hypothetical protein
MAEPGKRDGFGLKALQGVFPKRDAGFQRFDGYVALQDIVRRQEYDAHASFAYPFYNRMAGDIYRMIHNAVIYIFFFLFGL